MIIWMFTMTVWGLGPPDMEGKRVPTTPTISQGYYYSAKECQEFKNAQAAEYKAKGFWTYSIVCSKRSGPLVDQVRGEEDR